MLSVLNERETVPKQIKIGRNYMYTEEERRTRSKETLKLMIHTDRMHFRECDKRFASLNIHRSQHMMLMSIARMGEGVSQKELAREMGVSPAAVAKSLKKLECDGMITRIAFEGDARENRTTISERGAQIVERSREIMKQLDTETVALLTDDELDTLYALVTKMQSALREMQK